MTKRDAAKSVVVTFAMMLVVVAALCVAIGPPSPKPQPTPALPPEAKITPPPIPEPGTVSVAVNGDGLKFGYVPNPEGNEAFVATLAAPTLTLASPGMFADAPPEQDVFLYRALHAAYQERFGKAYSVGAQGIGDCVSWGWAQGIQVASAVEWQEGNTAEWWPVATESIYGGARVEGSGVSFGGYSDGSYGGAAARWVKEVGGITFRKKYDLHDLTNYSADRAKSWGNFGNGGQGDSGKFDQVAKEFPVGDVTLCTTFEEAAAAIRSGYPVPVCSSQGFASTRDSDGFARPSGSWAHCMCFVAVRYGSKPGLLCWNSWGTNWIGGGKYPEDQPEGSFWVDKQTVDRMLRGRDSYAVSKLKNFPFRPLDNAAWATVIHPTEDHFVRIVPKRERAEETIYAIAP